MKEDETVEVMKNFSILMLLFGALLFASESYAQSCWGGYTPSTNAIDCASGWTPSTPNGPCCATYKACNSYASPCPTYDPDYSATGGCDMSCTPIDSGVLFLLLGGAAFGGFMIMRRRETNLLPIPAE
jgi:hypothetical protein